LTSLTTVEVLPAVETTPLSAVDAREITDRIRGRLSDLKQDVLTAYEGRVHIALGYPSWEMYVAQELGVERAYTYKLMHAARAERRLTEIFADNGIGGSLVTLRETEVRGLDIDRAIEQVTDRVGDHADASSVIAVFRQVAEEMRHEPPKPDESVADTDIRHVASLTITAITDPVSGGSAWLFESPTGWNRGWVRIVHPRDPRDVLAAFAEIQDRYRRHLRGEELEGSTLSIARPRSSTHDPVDWTGPIDRNGVEGWLAPSGHFYPATSEPCRRMLQKRIALGLPTERVK